MTHTVAVPSGVRAEPRGWSYFADANALTIVDAHGFAETYRLFRLGTDDNGFELVAAGDDFGQAVVVLLGPSGTDGDSVCSCPDGDDPRPCPHRLALAALVRAWRRTPNP